MNTRLLPLLVLAGFLPANPSPAQGPDTTAPVASTNSSPPAIASAEARPAEPAAPAATTATTALAATSPPASPQPAPPDPGIRFDFAGMPYSEALLRFSQMAGKPLIADTVVEGTLSFSDPKPYTYGEALDTLNLVLATKSVMLVEDDRFLRLVPFKALPQMPIKLFHGLENIGEVRPGEIVTVVLDLQNLDAGELSQPISSMLSSAGSVASLSRGRGLIITDRLAHIERVRQLLATVDTASPVQRQVQTFNLRNVSGTLIADLLNRTFGLATAPKRTVFNEQRKSYEVLPPDPTDYITAIFAEASNTLVLFGPSERISMASDLIARFEADAGARASEIKVFYPQMPVEELAEMIRQAIPGVAGRAERGRDTDARAKVIADRTSNRLIVTAPAIGQLDAITTLLQRLDPSTQEVAPESSPDQAPPTRELRVVDLQSGSAQALAPLLRDALTDLGRDSKGPNATSQVRIQPAPAGNRLLLTGTPAALDDVLQLIRQLDAVSTPTEETRVFKLRQASANRIAGLIMSAMNSSDWRRRGGGGVVIAIPEERSNSLIVAAAAGHMQMIEQIVTQLEAVGTTSGRQLKILELTHNSAATIASTLARLFAPQLNTPDPTQRVALTPAPNDRALVLEADESLMPRLEETVKALDTPATSGGLELRVVETRSESASALAQMLREALAQLSRDRSSGDPLGRVQVQGSPVGNRLLLAGPGEALDRVEKLVQQLDNVSSTQTTRVFRLKSADPRQVANLIMSSMGSYDWRRRGTGGFVAAAAEERSRCVVVSAAENQMAMIEEVIQRLEEAGSLSGRQLKILELTNNSAATVASTLSRLFAPQLNTYDPAQRVALTPAPNDRALVLEANEHMMARLEEAARTLDTAAAGGTVEMRVVEVKSGSAQALAPMLGQVLSEMSRDSRGVNPLGRVQIQASPVGNRLLLAGAAEALDRVEKLVEQLDNVPVAQGTRVFKLQHAEARQVASLVLNTLGNYESRRRGGGGQIAAAAEDRSNTVVVSAPEAQLLLAEEIIQRLDEAGRAGGRQLQILPVQHNSAASIAAMVSQMFFPQVRTSDPNSRLALTAAPDDRALVVEADESLLTRIQEAVQALDVEPTRGTVEVRTYALPEGRSGELAAALNRVFADPSDARRRWDQAAPPAPPAPRFEIDSVSELLIVAATADQFTRIEKVLGDLRSAAALASQIRTFHLEHADPAQVVEVLQSMLLGDVSQRWRSSRGWRSGTGSGEVRVATAPALNAVVIQASPEKLAVATQLIRTLDRPQSESATATRTLRVQKAQPEAVALAVTQMLAAQGPPNTPPRVTVTAVPGSRSLLLSGPEPEVQRVTSLIEELDDDSQSDQLETRVFRLEHGNARDLTRVLTQLLEGLSRTRARFAARFQRETFTVAADERTNSLIVSGSTDYFRLVEQLLATLDQAPQHSDRRVQFYWLKNARAFEVSLKADALFAHRPRAERPLIESDSFSNSLTVVAKPADLLEIEDVIRQLDEMARDTSLQVRMIPLTDIPAARMAAMLTNLYSQLNEGQIRLVDRLPHSAHRPSPAVPSPVPTTPDTAPPATAPPTTLPATPATPVPAPAGPETPPEVIIAVDPTSNALILSGPAYELDHIDSLIYQLSASFTSPEFEIRQFRLEEADPVVVARVLNELFKPAPVPAQPQGNRPGNAPPGRTPNERSEGSSDPARRTGQNPPPGQAQAATPKVAVVADARTHSVIVRARPADFPLLESIIQQLDEEGLRAELAHRLILLEHVTPERLVPLLRQMLTQLGTARPGEPIALAPDPRSRGIFLVGRDRVLDRIEKLIQELDTSSPFAEIELRTLDLQHAQAAPLATLLKSVLRPDNANELTAEARQLQEQISRLRLQNDQGHPISLDLTQPIKIVADPAQGTADGGNRLVIGSTSTNLQALTAIVTLLDTPSAAGADSLRLFSLAHADAASLLQILNDLAARPAGPGRARAEDRPNLSVDERTNTLLASGTARALDRVAELVQQLDRELPDDLRGIRILPLQHADALPLAASLQRLLDERARPRGTGRRPTPSALRVVVIPDARSNSLMISGGPEAFELVQALLAQLDQPDTSVIGQIRLIPLEHANAGTLAPTLADLFTRRYQAARSPDLQRSRPVILADPHSNSLLVAAGADDNQALDALLPKLDAEPVATDGIIETFTLQHADVQRVSTLLRSLIDQGVYRPGLALTGGRRSPRDALALAPDPRSNSLIVSASPENLLIVKALIKQLDTADHAGAGDIRLFQLQHARASHLATVLEQFFRARRTSEAATGAAQRSAPVTVTADDRTNTLLITGGRESFDAVEQMIRQLDTDTPVARTHFRVFELRHTTATKLQGTLQRLFANRPPRIQGQPPEPVTVIADGWANALIIGASDDDLTMAASLIEKLDSPQPDGGPQVQVFQMAKADARRVEQTLQSLFRSSGVVGAGPGGLAAPVVLNVDERLNAIIVSAGETDLKRIAELVRKLDTDQVARVAEIRIFPLENSRAAEMALVLNNVLNNNPRALTEASPNRQSLLQFITRTEGGERLITSALKEGIIIVPDPRANSLVVSAPLDYMALLQEIIKHLDETAPTVATIKVFNLKNADARQMAQLLTTLFRLQAVGPAAGAQQSVQYVMPAGTDPTPAEGAAAANEVGAVVGSAQEDALSVTVDLRTNSLLVGGTEHYVALATQIITTLDATPAQERTAQVYRLKNARAQTVETSLRTFLQQDLQRIMSILGPTGVGTAQNILDREVSIVSETNSNSLLISASPRYFDEVRQLVDELDQPQPQVLIQVLLAEVTLDSTTELGVEWNYMSNTDPNFDTGTDFGQRQLLQDFGGYWASVTGSNYRFLVRALQNDGRLEVLSRPQILTADNQEATINIGQSVPLIQSTQVTPQGGTVSAIAYRDVGVILTVTPRISPDGYVKMDVAPSISDLSSSTVSVTKGEDFPIINQRTATTTVTVKSGQSVLIGGLIGTIDDMRTKKIPLLGDIPGLGVLFRSRSKAQTRKELLVILTPQILLKGEGQGKILDAQTFTEQELQGSTINKQIQRDPLQRRVLDPLLPPEAPSHETDEPAPATQRN
jgi:type II secretion system protein D